MRTLGTASPPVNGRRGGGDLTDELLRRDVWSERHLDAAGIPVLDAEIVTVGGGLGSFAFVDTLRIAGVATDRIRVLTTQPVPYATYAQLARNSQIPDHERLRSDSGSVMDNIWGWPSYALREAFAATTMRGFIAPILQVVTEPVFTDYYTPRAGDVYRSVDRETARIGWRTMLASGQARVVRRRAGGGYFTVLTPPAGTSVTKRVAYRSRVVHLGVGYPGLRYLPDLQVYRERTGDRRRVVNAYEPHDHVYEELLHRPGTVVVRGSGIVALRVLQRLIEDVEDRGARTTIVHLIRTYVAGPHGPSVFQRRRGGDGFAYQGFNWPRASWGGQWKRRLERLDGERRAALLELMGGTTTPKRKLWQQELARARRGGFYRVHVGQVEEVHPAPDGTIMTRLRGDDGSPVELAADFIVDATGLEASLRDHRLLADLLDHTDAHPNPIGRLDVGPDFEVRGTRSGVGRLYASGSATLGGYYAGVDSFLGLQYAALTIADELARLGICPRLTVGRSLAEWVRWMRNLPVGAAR